MQSPISRSRAKVSCVGKSSCIIRYVSPRTARFTADTVERRLPRGDPGAEVDIRAGTTTTEFSDDPSEPEAVTVTEGRISCNLDGGNDRAASGASGDDGAFVLLNEFEVTSWYRGV